MSGIEGDLQGIDPLELLYGDFGLFAQAMLSVVKPGVQIIWAPYLDLMAAKLQEVAEGKIRNLIITVPPRHLKSYLVSVAFPAWVLGRRPHAEFMSVSYSQEIARTFGEDCQRLMASRDYQEIFATRLVNSRQAPNLLKVQGYAGLRRATSLEGVSTGLGADFLGFDDPQKPGDARSDVLRTSTNGTFENTFLNRRNDTTRSSIIIVMQRLHEDDFVGHVLGLGGEWTVLNLPALAEADERIVFETPTGPAVFERREGEPLNPCRTSLEELARLRREMGEAQWASMYQQRPAPASGGLVETRSLVRTAPADMPATYDKIIQSWDTATKTGERNDYSVCTTWGVMGKHFYLLHVHRKRLDYPDLKPEVLRQAALWDASEVLIEDKASGTQLIQELQRASFGPVRAVMPKGDKETRMVNQTSLIGNGLVHVPAEAPWLAEYLHELAVFPNGRYDDQVDSTSQALDHLANRRVPWAGLLEYYQQEAEGWPKPKLGVMRFAHPQGGPTAFVGITGKDYRVEPDGFLHIDEPEDVTIMLRMPDWRRVADDEVCAPGSYLDCFGCWPEK